MSSELEARRRLSAGSLATLTSSQELADGSWRETTATRSAVRPLIVVLALLATLLFSLALASRADAVIYWGSDTGIGRANLDGSDPKTFIPLPARPSGVAVDDDHIYWPFRQTPTRFRIGRANLDGSDPRLGFITGLDRAPFGSPAVDANHIYWAASGGRDQYSIGRANLDGSGVDGSFIALASEASGVATDANYTYWDSDTGIGRANLDGSGVNESFVEVPPPAGALGCESAKGLAIDAAYIYTGRVCILGPPPAFRVFSAIARATLDGSDVDPDFIVDVGTTGLAVDANYIYWGGDSIGRANLDGSGINPNFIPNVPARTLAVDSRQIDGSASAKKTQEQKGKKIVVKVQVEAKEDLDATGTGKVKVRKKGYKLERVDKSVGEGRKKTLKLKPTNTGNKKIRKALKRGKKPKARVRVKLSDKAGNEKVEKLKVKLKR